MDLVGTLVGVVLAVALFLLAREFLCAYLKINARLDEQRRTNALLVVLLQAQGVSRDSLALVLDDPGSLISDLVSDSEGAAFRLGRAIGRSKR